MSTIPSRIGLLPCLFILFLWFILPRPDLPQSPELDPDTRSAALRAIAASTRSRRYIIKTSASSSSPSLGPAADDSDDMQILSQTNGLPAAAAAFSLRRRKSSVLIVSAIQPTPCRSGKGDHFNLLATKNKQDYARLHGYDFYLSNSLSDQRLSGAWNKVALIRDLLHWTDYEWLVWADYDALFMDVQFQIPFDKYEGRDFIVWGQHRQLFVNGDAHMGLNTGVFYVRNTEWSRKMFRQVADLGTGNGKDYEMKFRSHLSVYDWALFDQNGFTYWLKTTADESSSHVYLESDYDINSYWKDMPISKLQAKLDSDSISGGEMFIKHFMGCQFCSGINAIEAEKCEKDFLDSWRFANDRLERSTFRQ